jgi:hypothetical protein
MFCRHQHRVIDASAVSLRFAYASLSRDTLRSGQVTVGREFRKEPITNGDSANRFGRLYQVLKRQLQTSAINFVARLFLSMRQVRLALQMAHFSSRAIPRDSGGGCQANPRICRASLGVAT